MILGSTLKILAKGCPNYHLVGAALAKSSLSVCCCKHCEHSFDSTNFHLMCDRVSGKLTEEDMGHAIVAWNGTCDRAEFEQCECRDFKLEAKGK